MKNVLSPSTIATVGIILFGIGFITAGVLPDLLRILGMALIIIGAIGIFRKKRTTNDQS